MSGEVLMRATLLFIVLPARLFDVKQCDHCGKPEPAVHKKRGVAEDCGGGITPLVFGIDQIQIPQQALNDEGDSDVQVGSAQLLGNFGRHRIEGI